MRDFFFFAFFFARVLFLSFSLARLVFRPSLPPPPPLTSLMGHRLEKQQVWESYRLKSQSYSIEKSGNFTDVCMLGRTVGSGWGVQAGASAPPLPFTRCGGPPLGPTHYGPMAQTRISKPK